METQMGTIGVFQLSLVFVPLYNYCNYFFVSVPFFFICDELKCVIFGIVRPMIKE